MNPPPVSSFFDDFNGPVLNPIWQANLPDTHSGSFPYGYSQIAPYIGAPNFGFETLATNSVLRMTNTMGPLQRRGWSSSTNFITSDFHYEARFNTLNQSPTTSIDGFIEIWIMDATNSGRYDIVSPFGGGFGSDLSFFAGSSIDNSYTHSSYSYQNNTWYRLVLEGAPGQNIRASLCNDSGTELIGRTLGHGAAAFGSGFKIVLSQVVGASGVPYPVDVAVDYVSLTTGFPPAIIAQPTNQTAVFGGTASFNVTAGGLAPLSYQWNFNGTNISGATNTTLMLTNVQFNQAGNYAVLVTNAYGSVLSSNAMLTVLTPPSITTQPTNQTVAVGGTANFSVAASGSGPLSYQWNFNGTNIAGATNTSLALTNVQWSQAGNYAVLVTNVFGSIFSSNAVLVVTPDHFVWNQIPSPRFVNALFAITIQAQDMTNGLFTNFNGTVLLGSTNGVAVIPSISGSFVQGMWTGSVVISQTAAGLVLRADDGLGHFGLANPINVIELPTLGQKRSGNTMLILWPVGASGFVLETSSSLMPTAWVPVTDPPFQIGDQYVVPVVISDTNRFYRLRFPDP